MGEKYQNFGFLGQFSTPKNMIKKFFRNSNFSDFLGIKSEIHQLNQCIDINADLKLEQILLEKTLQESDRP